MILVFIRVLLKNRANRLFITTLPTYHPIYIYNIYLSDLPTYLPTYLLISYPIYIYDTYLCDLSCGTRGVSWTARRSSQSILKEINPKYLLEGLMLKLKLQYFGHLIQRVNSLEKTLML